MSGNIDGKLLISSTSDKLADSDSNKTSELLSQDAESDELANKPVSNSTKIEPPGSKNPPLKRAVSSESKKASSTAAKSTAATPSLVKVSLNVKSAPKVTVPSTSKSTVFSKPTVAATKSVADSGRSSPQVKYTASVVASAKIMYKQSEKPKTDTPKPETKSLFKTAQQKIASQVPKINLLLNKNSSVKLTKTPPSSAPKSSINSTPVDVDQLKVRVDSENAKLDRELLNEIGSLKKELEVVRNSSESAQEAFNSMKAEFEDLRLNNFQMKAQIKILEFNLEEEKNARLELEAKFASLSK